jgi:hypothetical protein
MAGSEKSTSSRQADAAPSTMEERHAKFVLKVADLPAQRWLCQAQPPGRAREIFFFRDRNEVPEVTQFHKR